MSKLSIFNQDAILNNYIQCMYITQLKAWSQNQTSPGFHIQIVGSAVHELLAFDFRNWKEERGLTNLPEYQPSLLQHGPAHKK